MPLFLSLLVSCLVSAATTQPARPTHSSSVELDDATLIVREYQSDRPKEGASSTRTRVMFHLEPNPAPGEPDPAAPVPLYDQEILTSEPGGPATEILAAERVGSHILLVVSMPDGVRGYWLEAQNPDPQAVVQARLMAFPWESNERLQVESARIFVTPPKDDPPGRVQGSIMLFVNLCGNERLSIFRYGFYSVPGEPGFVFAR